MQILTYHSLLGLGHNHEVHGTFDESVSRNNIFKVTSSLQSNKQPVLQFHCNLSTGIKPLLGHLFSYCTCKCLPRGKTRPLHANARSYLQANAWNRAITPRDSGWGENLLDGE